MIRVASKYRIAEERGATLITMLFFLTALIGLLSILLLAEQASLTEMRMQQTADLITKGARSAGEWEYKTPSGSWKKTLIATTEEANQVHADIVRGAREEAEILYQMNKESLQPDLHTVRITHQNGEEKGLYSRGIYRVAISVQKKIELLTSSIEVLFKRISQSGVYDS
ncbi:hypothetical protein ACQCN2_21165 [Brevibacillus ginsengisoli]|uniref:hypothetical protein n=1 Tax=Brevibacillus ginsengisoli TaxID=363854 RepID=UPI003CF4878D